MFRCASESALRRLAPDEDEEEGGRAAGSECHPLRPQLEAAGLVVRNVAAYVPARVRGGGGYLTISRG